MSKSQIDASGLNTKSLDEVMGDSDISSEYLEELVDDLDVVRVHRKWKDMQEAFKEVNKLARAHGVEAITDPDLSDRFWGDTRGIYINVGGQYNPTLIYDVVDHEYFVTDLETYLEYVESQKTPVWEIPISIEDEVGYVFTQKVWVKAETLEDAVDYVIDMQIEQGDEGIWGDDDAFDLGSVETTEAKSEDPEYQMWYISGLGDEDDEGMPETLTKALRIHPSEAEQVTEEDVRYPERFYDAMD